MCLFELMLYVQANSLGHVWTLPPLFWAFTQSEDVITSNKCLKYNHPTKLINTYGCFDLKKKKKVQVGKDQEKAQSEKDSHSKNRGGKKPN